MPAPFSHFLQWPEVAEQVDSTSDAVSLRAALERKGLLSQGTISDEQAALDYLPAWRRARDLVVGNRDRERERAEPRFKRGDFHAGFVDQEVERGLQRLRQLQGRTRHTSPIGRGSG